MVDLAPSARRQAQIRSSETRSLAPACVVLLARGSDGDLRRALDVVESRRAESDFQVLVVQEGLEAEDARWIAGELEVELLRVPLGTQRSAMCDMAMARATRPMILIRDVFAVHDASWLDCIAPTKVVTHEVALEAEVVTRVEPMADMPMVRRSDRPDEAVASVGIGRRRSIPKPASSHALEAAL